MAKGLVQKDGDTVVVRTIALPPDELAKEWNELVSLVQEMVRRRKCAQKDRALSSNKYPAYRVDLPCLDALLLEAEAAKAVEAVWDVDKTCEQLRSWYRGLPSFEEKVEMICAGLKAPKVYAMLFIGPPGSGKTHMLLSLYEVIPTAAFLSGMALTPAGLEDLLLMGRVDILLVDGIYNVVFKCLKGVSLAEAI